MKFLRRLVLGVLLSLLVVGLAGYFITPWPSVLVVRALFGLGTREASAKLERHVPANLTETLGISYDTSDPDALLDVYHPSSPMAGAPTVVWIHGGGFVSGGRSGIANYLKLLAGHGITAVSVDYTLAPSANYPTPVRQVARALAFLDREGDSYGVNGRAIILAGDSAGAQIAAQTANIVTSPGYSNLVGIAAPIDARQLKGVLLYCGFYDLTRLSRNRDWLRGWFIDTVTWSYSGKRDWRDAVGFDKMSVAAHLTPAFPPAFVSAGNADPLEAQSRALAGALQRQGVKVETLFFPANHTPKQPHEYQFDVESVEGRQALTRSVDWIRSLAVVREPILE